jgi:photosystem II stability/assembly factor-like uncharacterized protein
MKTRSCVFHVAILLVVLFAARTVVQAQWAIQNSNTTADLRGIHAVDGKVAWASGTNGTVLRTIDGGANWQTCAIPPDAEKLDFRGVQAFDAKTAIVMSSGPGDLSRLYKTTDGCETWKLVFTNPDKDGFWDGIVAYKAEHSWPDPHESGYVFGDPVNGHFAFFASTDGNLDKWEASDHLIGNPLNKIPLPRSAKEGLFAASNSAFWADSSGGLLFITGGSGGSYIYTSFPAKSWPSPPNGFDFHIQELPLAFSESAGAFSYAHGPGCEHWVWEPVGAVYSPTTRRVEFVICKNVVVGGDYKSPENSAGTAAYLDSNSNKWTAAETPPHGYRSAVAWDAAAKEWITVGPNGTDISTDDGKIWRALQPDAARGDAADADRNWNALSLPFVVGPKGRIGKLVQGSGSRVQGSEKQ